MPDPARLDAASVELGMDQIEIGKIKLSCVEIKARMRPDGRTPVRADAPVASYCFDPSAPMLRVERIFTSVFVEFNRLTKIQNRIFGENIAIAARQHKLLTFTATETDGLQKEDAALTPPTDAKPLAAQDLPPSSAQSSHTTGKPTPVYPVWAKASHISGTVVLDAMIGVDGRLRDIRVLANPSPLLTASAKDAVGQWQYTPYLIDGEPQEVNTITNVVFALGN